MCVKGMCGGRVGVACTCVDVMFVFLQDKVGINTEKEADVPGSPPILWGRAA